MYRKIAAVWMSLVMMLSVILILVEIAPIARGATIIYVDDVPGGGSGNPPENYTRIQYAIDNASSGDTIFVYDGVYYENIVIDKTLTITGEYQQYPIIHGGDGVITIKILSPNVVLEGLTITLNETGNPKDNGILIQSSYNRINGCIFSIIPDFAILCSGDVNHCVFENNTFLGYFANGIRTEGNNFNDNLIANNTFDGGAYGVVAYGLDHFNDVEIVNNDFIGYIWKAIVLSNNQMYESARRLHIHDNTISMFEHGIYLKRTFDSFIYENTIIDCESHAIFFDSDSSNNLIYHNNLIDNNAGGSAQAYDAGSNQWNLAYPSGGNYWSDYDGVDNNSTVTQDVPPPDGMGDTPYSIDTNTHDYYPLMNPWGNFTFLYPGWNLVSCPFVQSDTDVYSVLSSIKGSYNSVQHYNSSDGNDYWKHMRTSKPNHLDDLSDIDHTMGFWIYNTQSGLVQYKYPGSLSNQNQTISLHPGWNMVGYPSLTSYNRTTGLNNLTCGVDVDCIQWFDSADKTWYFMGPDDLFVHGRGYWIHSKVEAEWEVPL